MSTSEIRRVRLETLDMQDGLRDDSQTHAPTMFVGTVTGSPGTTVPAYFKVTTQSISGTPSEGGSATFADGIGTPLVYVLGPTAPTLGQKLTCWRAGGGWIAETCCGEETKCGNPCSVCDGVYLLDEGTATDCNGVHPMSISNGALWLNRVPPLGLGRWATDILSGPMSVVNNDMLGHCTIAEGPGNYGWGIQCASGGKVGIGLVTWRYDSCNNEAGCFGNGFFGPDWSTYVPTQFVTPICDGSTLTATANFPPIPVGFECPAPLSMPCGGSVTIEIPIESPEPHICCQPCPFPKKDLTLTFVFSPYGTAIYTLIFNGQSGWATAGCPPIPSEFEGRTVKFTFTCSGQGSSIGPLLIEQEFGPPEPPCSEIAFTNVFGYLNPDPSTPPEFVLLTDYTCRPFHLHWNVPGRLASLDVYIDE